MFDYWIKLNIALAVFYLLYRWLFSDDTFFELRRYMLLAMIGTAFLYPTIDLSWWMKESPALVNLGATYTEWLPEVTITVISPSLAHPIDWNQVATIGYGTVVALLALLLIKRIGHLCLIRFRSRPFTVNGVRVRRIETHDTPFSFFHWIFLNPRLHSTEELAEIMAHETVHTSKYHTIDVLLSQLLTLLCWINPAAWLLSLEVRKNLEFEADHRVVKSGFKSKPYQFHLVKLAQRPTAMAICNHINVSPLKERIIMLNKKRTHPMKRTLYMVMLPVASMFVLTNSVTALNVSKTVTDKAVSVIEEVIPSIVSEPPAWEEKAVEARKSSEATRAKVESVRKETDAVRADQNNRNKNLNGTGSVDDTSVIIDEKTRKERTVYIATEKRPRYPGGELELMKEISHTVKYPEECAKKGIQGRVICSFVVEVDGSISNVKVARAVDPLLDAEAIRSIKQLKRFEPGIMGGKAVPVMYNVPVMFRLR